MASPPPVSNPVSPTDPTSTSGPSPPRSTPSLQPTSSLPSSTSSLSSSTSAPSSSTSSLSSSASTLSSSTTSSVTSLTPPNSIPPLQTGQNGPSTVTETTSATAPPSTSAGIPKAKSFLQNKPLSGSVFGLAGLAGLVILIIVVTSYVRKRNRKRLLADASNFTFEPKGIEDGTSDENHSRSGLVGRHDSGHGLNGYPSGTGATGGFTGVGVGGVPRSGPPPPMPVYPPQDYVGYDGAYPPQYHNLSNIPVGYNPTPNPYDMYNLGNDRRYSNGPGQHDSYYTSGGDHPVPRQLQPGLRPAQGPIFPQHSSTGPSPLNSSPPISSTTSPMPASLQPSASDQYTIPKLHSSGALPDTFGQRNSVDDDAYGGAFLGPESPPGPRTLQVSNA